MHVTSQWLISLLDYSENGGSKILLNTWNMYTNVHGVVSRKAGVFHDNRCRVDVFNPLQSGEIRPTRCNNCVFILRIGFTLHVSGDNLTHYQEYNAVYGHR